MGSRKTGKVQQTGVLFIQYLNKNRAEAGTQSQDQHEGFRKQQPKKRRSAE